MTELNIHFNISMSKLIQDSFCLNGTKYKITYSHSDVFTQTLGIN